MAKFLNHWQRLNGRQRQFVRLYNGSTEIAGNATRCYMAAYGLTNEYSAQRAGSRLLKNPSVKALLDAADRKAREELALDAQFVLEQSYRLYARAMGDDTFDQVTIEADANTGEERIHVHSRRDYDPATARAALQLIGQHKDVQAFTQQVEHTHVHHLEQRLAARSKAIEGRAQVLRVEQLPAADRVDLPGHASAAHEIPADRAVGDDGSSYVAHAEGRGEADVTRGAQGAKRVHPGGGQDERAREKKISAPEREGATAD